MFSAVLAVQLSNAPAARMRRAAPDGIAAVRAKGAYVFYYVEVIPATLAVQLSNAPTARKLPFRTRKRKTPRACRVEAFRDLRKR